MVYAENNTKNMRGFLMRKYKALVNEIKRKVPIGESFDLIERKLNIAGKEATMFFTDALTDGGTMQRLLFSLFSLKEQQMEEVSSAEEFIEKRLPFLDTMVIYDVEQAIKFLYSGLVPLLVEG